MAFDIAGAKAAGYSDQEINSYLSSKGQKTPKKDNGFELLDLLPVAGGIVGGVVGTPFGGPVGTIAGGSVGSAAGEFIRQKIKGEETDYGKVGQEGAMGLMGGVVGKVGGAAVRGASKIISKAPKVANIVTEKAAANVVKASPSAYSKAADSGIDPIKIYRKYAPTLGTDTDTILGKVARGKERTVGLIDKMIADEEKIIQSVAKGGGSNIRIGQVDIVKALKQEAKAIAKELGGADRLKAINEVIRNAQNKYRNGVTLSTALNTLRKANEQFGKSILDDAGDAVMTAAQKLEANTLRSVLKTAFPRMREGLDKQQELIILREFLKVARGKERVAGISLSPIRLLEQNVLTPLAKNISTRIPSLASPVVEEGAQTAAQTGAGGVPGVISNMLPKGTVSQTAGQVASRFFQEPTLDQSTLDEGIPVDTQESTNPLQSVLTPEMVAQAYLTLPKEDADKIAKAYEANKAATPKAMSAPAKQLIANAKSGLRSLNAIEQFIEKDPSILIRASLPGSLGARTYIKRLQEAADVYARLRTGAALNNQEMEYYPAQLPGLLDYGNPQAVADSLRIAREFFTDLAGRQGAAAEEVVGTFTPQ
jgi:hypothetical protein